MFYTDMDSNASSKIISAKVGSKQRKVIAHSFGSEKYYGLTIDRKNQKLYWFVTGSGSIMESSFDGKCIKTITMIQEDIIQMVFREDHLFYLVKKKQFGAAIKKLNPTSLTISTLAEVSHPLYLLGTYSERTLKPEQCRDVPKCAVKEREFLYPFGVEVRDQVVAPGNAYGRLNFEKGIPFFSRLKSDIYINVNGHITADQPESKFMLKFPTNFPLLGMYMMPLTTEYGGNVFFRATTDEAILKRAATDAALSHEVKRGFMPKVAMVITWSNVSVKFNRVKKMTFQTVYTSDYNDSVAIALYDKLDLSGAVYGRSEVACFNYMAPETIRPFSSRLANTSNVGVPGLHVSRVSIGECSLRKEVNDIDIGFEFKYSSGYEIVHPFYFNGSAAHKLAAVFTQVMSWNYTSVSFTTNVKYYFNEIHFKYIYLIHAPFPTWWGVLSMVVRESLTETSSIQDGHVHITSFWSGTQCHSENFKMMMDDTPAIKLGVMIDYSAFNAMNGYTNVWLRNVSRNGLTFCFKEIIAFSGPRNISVDYLAVTPNSKHFTEVGVLNVSNSVKSNVESNRGMQENLCERINYKYVYSMPPAMFVTPEEGVALGGEPVAWVKATYKDYGIICAQNSRKMDTKVHYIIHGKMDACSNISCPENMQCQFDDKGKPSCGCIKTCNGTEPFEFCGSNLQTYTSKCELMKEVCEMQMKMNQTMVNVTVAYEGRCKQFPYQTGLTELEAQHNMSVTFCKHVNVDPRTFHPSYPLHVLLTVVWKQKQGYNDQVHDATASWTEDVSANGFKACVMLAGRHYFQKIPPPSVHWVAYQKGVAYSPDLEIGVVHMKTWYSGSRCQHISLKKYSRQTKILVSIQHSIPNKMIDGMTVWVEKTYFAEGMGYMCKVCARELQNFDGMHKGIQINWMAIHEPMASYIIELREVHFPRMQHTMDEPIPTSCKTVSFNYMFPSLADPTVIITAVNMSLTGEMAKSPFSPHDIAVWLESNNDTHMTICYKSLRAGMHREQIRVQYAIWPKLCMGNWKFYDGKCYGNNGVNNVATYETAKSFYCPNLNASLSSADSDSKSFFMAKTFSSSDAPWAGYKYRIAKGLDQWMNPFMQPMVYSNWSPGQPSNKLNECVVISAQAPHKWFTKDCKQTSSYVCEKDALLKERGCKCMNGGVCIVKEGVISCTCPTGFEGYMCEFSQSAAMECRKYKLHKEPERSFVNTKSYEKTTCPSLVDYRWHRYDGMMMVENRCANRENHCGTRYPGWLAGDHPSVEKGAVERAIHFYKEGKCTNNLGRVMVRNCGTYYVYKFLELPYMCEYGFCLERFKGMPQKAMATAGHLGCYKLSNEPLGCRLETIDAQLAFSNKIQKSMANAVEWLRRDQYSNGLWFDIHATGWVLQSLVLTGYVNDKATCTKTMQNANNTIQLTRNIDLRPGGRLAMTMIGMRAICIDLTNFQGKNLVQSLMDKMSKFPKDDFNNYYQYSLGVIALYVNGKELSLEYGERIMSELENKLNVSNRMSDTEALSLIALSAMLKQNKLSKQFLDKVKKLLKDRVSKIDRIINEAPLDNLVTIAHLVQVLQSENIRLSSKPYCKKTFDWLLDKQDQHGSFGGMMPTATLLPMLRGRSILELRNWNCAKEKDVVDAEKIKDFIVSRITVKPTGSPTPEKQINVTIEAKSIVPGTVFSTGNVTISLSNGTTALQALKEASTLDPLFRYRAKASEWGPYIEMIGNVENNSVKKAYWMFYVNGEMATVGVGKYKLSDGDYVSFIYETSSH